VGASNKEVHKTIPDNQADDKRLTASIQKSTQKFIQKFIQKSTQKFIQKFIQKSTQKFIQKHSHQRR